MTIHQEGPSDETRVHVLLAAHNGSAHLHSQVASILSQVRVTVTMTIRVDPSTDDTAQVALSLANDDPRVIVRINEVPSGDSAANFLKLLTEDVPEDCDFVAFADQDDIWFKGKLSRAVAQLDAHRAHGYSSDVLAWWPGRKVRRIRKSHPQRLWDHRFSAPGPGCTFVMRAGLARAIAEVVRAHRQEAAAVPLHDWLIYAWAREHGYVWHIDDVPGMLYRQHAANVIGANLGLIAARSRLSRSSRRWYVDAVAAVSEFLEASRDPRLLTALPPRTRAWQLIHWRELRRPLREAVACAAMLVLTPHRERRGHRG